MLTERIIKDVMVSILSGCAEYKPGTKEVICKDQYDRNATVEIRDGIVIEKIYYGLSDIVHYTVTYKNYKLDGEELGYYQGGTLFWRCGYKDGEQYGIDIQYNYDGKLEHHQLHKDGKMIFYRQYDTDD